jgi:hypothetical protein
MDRRFYGQLLCFALATLAAASSQAATYYLRADGNDAADGLSHDRAWATLDRANRQTMRESDRVLLHEGDRFVGQLIVAWGGTPDAPVTIGSYYLQDGTATPGFRTTRPMIDGEDRLPAYEHDSLVRVQGDYVHIENLRVVNSQGRAIDFTRSANGSVMKCETENTYKSGIKFVNSNGAFVLENFVSQAGLAWPQAAASWGGAIELVASNDGVIRGNTVSEVYGEGINANHGSARSVIEDNYVFAARAVGIYVDAAPDTTVRRNLVVGTTNSQFWRDSQSVGGGIVLNNEQYHYDGALPPDVQSQRAKIYDNIVSFTQTGVGLWGQYPATTYDDVLVFNNTFVDNDTQLTVRGKPAPGAKFINNILLSVSPGTRDTDKTSLGGMIAKSNYFSRGNPGGDLADIGNRYQGLALVRSTGWRSFSTVNPLMWRDFSLVRGSVGVGVGDEEPARMAGDDDKFDLDYNGLAHNAPMDFGALHFSSSAISKPKKPTQFAARP